MEKSAADIKIEETSQYIIKLEKQLTGVVKHIDGMIRRLKETSTNLFEFGQSLNFLGQSEGDAVGTALAQMGETIENLANCYATQAEEEISKFMEPLDDYARMMHSVKHAIQQRQEKRNNYITAMADVEGKSLAWKKLQNVPGKEALARQKEEVVLLAEEHRERVKNEYERVTERLLAEFETFRQRKALDIKEIVYNFVELQVMFCFFFCLLFIDINHFNVIFFFFESHCDRLKTTVAWKRFGRTFCPNYSRFRCLGA